MKKILLMASALTLVVSSNAYADTFGFENITGNNIGDAAIGEAQLFVDVEEYAAGQVMFTFRNTGPEPSSITDIYFEDGAPLMAYDSFVYGTTGVDFTVGAAPHNLPGGADPSWNFAADYSFDSSSPTQPNGINPSESLGIIFDVSGSSSLAEILGAIGDGSLEIGIHVQGFDSEGSESFLLTPPVETEPASEPVPEPATMLLFGTGLAGLAGLRRKARG